jgi:hypothetical protein
MDIEEAKEEFIRIWETVFMDDTIEPTLRSSRLENIIGAILRKKGLSEDQQLLDSRAADGGCQMYVAQFCCVSG